ncbi:MAG TPA: D-alanyl-D-alanine endopeptidase [Noviherbaspirillum sp.]
MLRYMLAIFLLVHVFFVGTPAWSKDGRITASARKPSVQKTTPAKRKAVRVPTSKKKLRTAIRTRSPASAEPRRAASKRSITARSMRKGARLAHRAPRHVASAALADSLDIEDSLNLKSSAVLVMDPARGEVLFTKNADAVLPIASITKLMTALVVLEAGQDMREVLTVTRDDIDTIKHTSSRLRIGSKLTRANMLHIALMSSENRAASALGRHYPGGLKAFVAAMNAKAKSLGMHSTRYVEPTGLSSQNVSSASDLAKLVMAAQQQPVIRKYSTNREYSVDPGGPVLRYRNSNRLVANPQWDIVLQKTGYIAEAGRCLVMNTIIDGRSIVMVFLDARGKFARAADAGRIRQWLERLQM